MLSLQEVRSLQSGCEQGGRAMPGEVTMFWLIHLFLGVVLPVMALVGCCRRDEEEKTAVDATAEFI